MVIAILVVFAVVVLVARGHGSGLSTERGDYVPLDLGPVSATDVALLRPPTGLWGYNMQATDDAMEQIAASIRERDIRIVALEQLVTDLSRDQAPSAPLGSPYAGARHRRSSADLYREQAAYGDSPTEAAYPGAAYAETDQSRAGYPATEQSQAEYPEAAYPEAQYSEAEYPETEPLQARSRAAESQEAAYQDAAYREAGSPAADYPEARYPEARYPEAGTAEPGPSEDGPSEDGPSEAGTGLPPEQSHD
jgi:nicotinate-nucleotide--dimethylbenzimidazole phosphoribosyltransferase